jgi:hypothetical protein
VFISSFGSGVVTLSSSSCPSRDAVLAEGNDETWTNGWNYRVANAQNL